MKDCTTCKYGYKDERLGIPMCHHPKRFSEDCIDFNMHEEKEIKESEKPVPNNLEEAAKENAKEISTDWIKTICIENFISGANWQKEQDHYACRQCEKDYDIVFYKGVQHAIKMLKEEAIGGTVCGRVVSHINIRFAEGVGKYLVPKDISHIPADISRYKIGDKVKVIILKDE